MDETLSISMTVNGDKEDALVDPRLTLSDFLRHELGLTGTKVGCEHGSCGACTVIVDGESVRSCLMLAVQADGTTVETVESLANLDGELNPLQLAFQKHHALQCGYCTSGFLMSLTARLRKGPIKSDAEARIALSGNICRCTGYAGMVEAVLEVGGTDAASNQEGDK